MKLAVMPNAKMRTDGFSGVVRIALRQLAVVPFLVFCCLQFGSPAHSAQKTFELAPGDAITFDLLDDTELPMSLTISDNGKAQFPLIGGVEIAGLDVEDAIKAVRKEYQDRQIFLDPKFSLSIATLRPLFVLGEVRNPGSFPFSFGMTVEKAIGLAGGTPVLTTDPAQGILTQARLRGDIDSAEGEIAHEAVYAARLAAELAGRDEINLADAPELARPFLKDAPVEAIVEIEKRILRSEQANFQNQLSILEQGVVEAEKGLQLLDDLAAQQQVVLQKISKDLERIGALRKSGLNTQNEVTQAERNESSEKARLIEIFGEMSRSRREFGSLKLDLARLKSDRERDLLKQLQERQFAIEKLINSRRSSQQQLVLMSSAISDEKNKDEAKTYSYEVRRTAKGTTTRISVTSLSELEPGDVVIVSIASI
jgi:polysaccharide biosynthesis/export protein ExoF